MQFFIEESFNIFRSKNLDSLMFTSFIGLMFTSGIAILIDSLQSIEMLNDVAQQFIDQEQCLLCSKKSECEESIELDKIAMVYKNNYDIAETGKEFYEIIDKELTILAINDNTNGLLN